MHISSQCMTLRTASSNLSVNAPSREQMWPTIAHRTVTAARLATRGMYCDIDDVSGQRTSYVLHPHQQGAVKAAVLRWAQ